MALFFDTDSAPEASFRFTILTPTFNRAHTLERVYQSLVAQDRCDFEWLVVDDGSTDGTAGIVTAWQASAPFPIRYVHQSNGHKKVALNTGFKAARGDFTVILDSDDALTPNALTVFARAWEDIPADQRHRFSGIRALCISPDGRVIGEQFPRAPLDASANDLLYRYRVHGEKLSCDRTDVLRLFPFPEDVDGLVPEQVLWSQISRNYKCRCINEPVRIYYDTEDSLSRKLALSSYKNDLEGLAYAYTFVLDHDNGWFFVNPKILIKVAANRDRFLHHLRRNGSKKRYRIMTKGGQAIALAFGWIGYLLYWRDKTRQSR